MKAVEMGKRIYSKANEDHMTFSRIIKQGATALNVARREKAKAEVNLKKSWDAAAAAPDCSILQIQKDHADEKIEELKEMKVKYEKKIEKLEKKIEELEKKVEKAKTSSTDTTGDAVVEAHRRKKIIDQEAYERKLEADERREDKKEAKKMRAKSRRYGETETLYRSGGSFNSRFSGNYDDDRRIRSNYHARSPPIYRDQYHYHTPRSPPLYRDQYHYHAPRSPPVYRNQHHHHARSPPIYRDQSQGRSQHARSCSRSRDRSHRTHSQSVDMSHGRSPPLHGQSCDRSRCSQSTPDQRSRSQHTPPRGWSQRNNSLVPVRRYSSLT
jgi:hypothetical protein